MDYPEKPSSLGEHLKKRRLDLELGQKEVARRIGATVQSVCNWEKGRSKPEPRHYPKIFLFLGYDPIPTPVSLPDRIRAARRRQGISQQVLARRLGLDPGTVRAWEAGTVTRPFSRIARIFEDYVEGV